MSAVAKPKVLVCDPIHESSLNVMRGAGLHVDYKPAITHEDLLKMARNYDALIVRGRTKVRKDVIETARNLKVIGRAGAGIDNIDVDEAVRHGVRVETSASGPATSTAELVLGLMIGLARRIPQADGSMKEGKWLKKEMMGSQLKGKIVGIVGVGKVGSRVARRAKAFGMRIVFHELLPRQEVIRELDARAVSLEELLRESDFVTLHVPLTEETYHMIGERELRLMKRSAFLVNTSRGSVIDSDALLKALKGNWIAGAALDVYEEEPPKDLAIIRMPNVICTPHIGSQTIESQRECAAVIAKKIIAILGGK